jgi:hypothetical protein
VTSTDVAPSPVAAASTGQLRRATGLAWVERSEWWLLGAIVVIGAVARAGGFSTGTLYRDDAWVALTTRVPLGTAARMVVTTPGFVLAERAWIGWFGHNLVLEQLPTFLASVAGIAVVGRLARWWGLSAPASLVAAGLVAVANADVVYATRVKPYAFDLLAACLVLWLAESIRRDGAGRELWLAVASVCICAFSLTPVPLVIGVWVALGVDALVRKRLSMRLVASAVVTAAGLAALWLAVKGGVSPRLRSSWDGHYLVVSSAHAFAHSARTIVDGLVAGIGVTTPSLGLHGLGGIDRVAILAFGVLGLIAWRRQLLPLAAVLSAVVLSIPSIVPLGTGRTDAYLYPALAMLVAEGAAVTWRAIARWLAPALVVALAGTVAFAGLLGADRVLHAPSYPGGNFAVVAAKLHHDLATGDLVVIGGTARWPWSYYDEPTVKIRFSDLYNNGYTTLSTVTNTVVIPGTPIEGGYAPSVNTAVARARADRCADVAYVESDDWPAMPMTLLDDLTHLGGLRVTTGPVVVDGYRYWTLVPTAPCERSHGTPTYSVP